MKKELFRKGVHTLLALFFAISAIFVGKEILIAFAGVIFLVFVLLRFFSKKLPALLAPKVTYGELFFILGVVGALILTFPNSGVFQIAMCILAFADPVAGLYGMFLGNHVYTVCGEKRTLEGSIACFFVSLLVLVSFGITFWSALLFALLLAGIEAVSLRGSDNFFLPITTVVLIFSFT